MKTNQRSSARPSPICRRRSAPIASISTEVASTGSLGRPSARATTLVEPAGTMPSRGTPGCTPSVSSPLTTSLTVPSPPRATTTSNAVAHRPAGQRRGMAPVGGFLDLELGVGGQRVHQDVPLAQRGRGGSRIGHHQDSHRLTVPPGPGAGGSPVAPDIGPLAYARAVSDTPADTCRATRPPTACPRASGRPPSWCWPRPPRWPSPRWCCWCWRSCTPPPGSGRRWRSSASRCSARRCWRLCGRGLLRLRPAARSPVILVQLLAVPVGYSLGIQAGRPLVGVPILLVAIAVLVLLLLPSSRQALDRVL